MGTSKRPPKIPGWGQSERTHPQWKKVPIPILKIQLGSIASFSGLPELKLPVQNLHTLKDLNKYVAQLLETNSSLKTEVDYLKERCCHLEEEKISSVFDASAQRKSNTTMSEKLIHSGISDRVWRSKLVDMDENLATSGEMELMIPHEDGNLFNSSKMVKYGMVVDAKNELESIGIDKSNVILVSCIENNHEDANFSIEIDIPESAQENLDGKCGDSKVGLKKSLESLGKGEKLALAEAMQKLSENLITEAGTEPTDGTSVDNSPTQAFRLGFEASKQANTGKDDKSNLIFFLTHFDRWKTVGKSAREISKDPQPSNNS